MHRFTRYTIALLVGGVAMAGAAVDSHSIVLLLGVFVVYALAFGITLRYPSLLWGHRLDDRWSAGVFAGGLTFGVLSLAQGLGPEINYGAGILGLGLTLFGAATGFWMADASDS